MVQEKRLKKFLLFDFAFSLFFLSIFSFLNMSVEDSISDDFAVLQEETIEAIQQVEAYQRKLMAPIYHKRREIAKKIPHFWSQSVTIKV